jgi:hypothetical protein
MLHQIRILFPQVPGMDQVVTVLMLNELVIID